jgi:signal transduction histidine kinase
MTPESSSNRESSLSSILIVEDNPVDARLLASRIRGIVGDTLTAKQAMTLKVALELAAETAFDVVLLDLSLPDSEGIATLKTFAERFSNLPVVVLTGSSEDRIALDALEAGAQDFLVKGVYDAKSLLRAMRYAQHRKRAELERKSMQVQLQTSQRLESLGQLAAGIAHEINTPIQFIGDNTAFLRDAFSDLLSAVEAARSAGGGEDASLDLDFLAEEIPKAIEQTLEGVARVAGIVRAMKEFAHPGSQDRAFVDLNASLETAITVSRNEWKYVAEIERRFAEDLPRVPCFAAELNQAFLNMIVNAAHAITDRLGQGSAEKGRITIETRADPEFVTVAISDTGCGIPDSIRNRIFDPFFTTKEPGRGTGQGLAIAFRAVVDRHHGRIDVRSEPGAGTTFEIRLPREPDGAAVAAIGTAPVAIGN